MRLRHSLFLLAGVASLVLAAPASALNCTSLSTGTYSDAARWDCGVIPNADDTVIIDNGHTVTLDANVDVQGLVINSGGTFNLGGFTMTSVDPGNSFLTNNGTFEAPGFSTFIFDQDGAVFGTSVTNFSVLTIRAGVDFSAFGSPQATVSGFLFIEAGGFIRDADGGATPPAYGPMAVLSYPSGVVYGRGAEWTPTATPGNVSIPSGTTLQVGTPGGTLNAVSQLSISGTLDMQAAPTALDVGSVSIGGSGTLTLSTAVGGDLFVEGTFVNSGTFNANNRAVTFDGPTGTIFADGSPIAFDFLTIDTPSGTRIFNEVSVDDAFTLTTGQVSLFPGASFTSTPPSGLTGTTDQVTITGDAGWRMLSVPASSLSTADITDDGTGIRTGDQPSILYGYDGTAWINPVPVLDFNLSGTEGFYLYFYDDATDGLLPITLDVNHSSVAADDPVSAALNRGAGNLGWSQIGNPFENAFDVERLVGTGGFAPQSAMIWTDGAGTNGEGSFVSTTTIGDQIPVWQGAWINVPMTTGDFAPTAVTFPDIAQENGAGTFQSRTASERSFVQLILTGPDGTTDEAAVAVFTASGRDGWDTRDMGKLLPPSATHALLAFATEHEIDGVDEVMLKAQESRSDDLTEAVALPVDLLLAGVSGTFEIEPVLNALPADWDVILEDRAKGTWTDLRTSGYSFEATTTAGPRGSAVTGAASRTGTEAERFVLHVGPGARVVSTTEAPEVSTVLGAVWPNPAARTAQATLTLAASERVQADLLDALGRTVATVLDGDLAGGATHEIVLDLDGLASGVYVLRVQGETFVTSRRLTVTR